MTNEMSSCAITLDTLYKVSMIVIALFNAFYAYKLNLFKNKKEEQREEEQRHRIEADRRIALVKLLVFDYNLKHLYKFFSDADTQLQKLKSKETDKKLVETELQKIFKELSDNFIIFLLATASPLGRNLQNISDEMRDKLVENISDDGINLWVESYYNDKIKIVFDQGRNKMINLLFQYDGK